jgi:hypothetical protein
MSSSKNSGWSSAVALAIALQVLVLAAACGTPQTDEAQQAAEAQSAAAGDGAAAQPASDEDDEALRPARLSFVEGSVALRTADDAEWETVDSNTAVFEGYELYADEDASAEVALGDDQFLRFGEGAAVNVSRLDDNWTQVGMTSGTGTLALGDFGPDEHYEINAPGGALVPQRGGEYRVDVSEDGETIITVLRGTAEITTPTGSFEAVEGDVVRLGYEEEGAISVVSDAAPEYSDDWDRWNDERDVYYEDLDQREVDDGVRDLYGRDDILGVAELVAHGVWRLVDNDRHVWQPNVSSRDDWAPYQDGYWDYSPSVGYSWVSNESWGWAPYHYGRWDHTPDYGWCWAPYDGQVTRGREAFREPYRWRPAHVYLWQPPEQQYYAWVPLAPGEPYMRYTTSYYSSAPQPQYVNVDFRPRYLRERRGVVYLTPDGLERRQRPRRAEREFLARMDRARVEDARMVRLPKPARIVTPERVAPARLRPSERAARRALVVDPRGVERAQKADSKRQKRQGERQVARQERAVRQGERKALRVERKKAAEVTGDIRAKRGGAKAGRRAEQRQAREMKQAGVVRRPRAERAATRIEPAERPAPDERAEKAQRRAERRAARGAPSADQPIVERPKRGERVERPKRGERVERPAKQPGARIERQGRQQRRADAGGTVSASKAARVDRPARQARIERQQIRATREAARGGQKGGQKPNKRVRP